MKAMLAIAATAMFCAGCATETQKAATGADNKGAPVITGSRIPRDHSGADAVKTTSGDAYEISRTIGSTPQGAGQLGRPGN